jgi:hypothetical protein
VLPLFQLIFPSETWFFGIYLNFQRQKSLKNQYLQGSGQILPNKFHWKAFQQHQRKARSNSSEILSYDLI